jgi:hypothetical protein
MFGQPHLFRQTKDFRGLVPVCWQGWLCTLIWMLVLFVPALGLSSSGRAPEAIVWILVVAVFLIWETRQIRKQVYAVATDEDVLYIGDESEDCSVATRNYRFRLRD